MTNKYILSTLCFLSLFCGNVQAQAKPDVVILPTPIPYLNILSNKGRSMNINNYSQQTDDVAVNITSTNKNDGAIWATCENEQRGCVKIATKGQGGVNASALAIKLDNNSLLQGINIDMGTSTNKSINIKQNGQYVFQFACPNNICTLKVMGDIEYSGNLTKK